MFTFCSGFQKKTIILRNNWVLVCLVLVGCFLFFFALKLVQHSISLLPQNCISMFVELHREFFFAASYWLITCFNITANFSLHVIKSSLFCRLFISAFTKVAFSLSNADGDLGLGALEVLLWWSHQRRESQLEHRGQFKWIRIHFTLHLPGTCSAVCITGGKIRQTGRLGSFVKSIRTVQASSIPETGGFDSFSVSVHSRLVL